MARNLPTNVVTQINGEQVRLVFLVKLSTSTNILLTNHSKDITYSSDTYVADGSFSTLNQVKETGALEYSNISLELTNPGTTNKNTLLNGGYVNKDAVIYIGFLDSDETLINVFEYFKGQVGNVSVSDTEKGVMLQIELVNQFKNWEIKKGRKYTDQSQQDAFPGDKGLAFAHESKKDIRWRA